MTRFAKLAFTLVCLISSPMHAQKILTNRTTSSQGCVDRTVTPWVIGHARKDGKCIGEMTQDPTPGALALVPGIGLPGALNKADDTTTGPLTTMALTVPSLPGLTNAVPTNISVSPILADTPGMILTDLTRSFVINGNATSFSQDNPNGILFLGRAVGGWQGYVTTTASANYTGTTLPVADASKLYAGMSVNGVKTVAAPVGNTIQIASPLTVTNGQTLNFYGQSNGANFFSLLTYNDGPNSQEAAIAGAANVTATHNSQGDGTHAGAALGVTGSCNMYVANGIACWPGIFAFNDYVGTPDPSYPQYAAEFDNYGYGTDAHHARLVVQIVCNTTYAIASECYDGLALSTGSFSKYINTIDFGTSHSVNGINATSATFDTYALAFPGFRLDPAGNVIAQNISFLNATGAGISLAATGAVAFGKGSQIARSGNTIFYDVPAGGSHTFRNGTVTAPIFMKR